MSGTLWELASSSWSCTIWDLWAALWIRSLESGMRFFSQCWWAEVSFLLAVRFFMGTDGILLDLNWHFLVSNIVSNWLHHWATIKKNISLNLLYHSDNHKQRSMLTSLAATLSKTSSWQLSLRLPRASSVLRCNTMISAWQADGWQRPLEILSNSVGVWMVFKRLTDRQRLTFDMFSVHWMCLSTAKAQWETCGTKIAMTQKAHREVQHHAATFFGAFGKGGARGCAIEPDEKLGSRWRCYIIYSMYSYYIIDHAVSPSYWHSLLHKIMRIVRTIWVL